MDHTNMEK